MATGSQSDITSRLQALIPNGWFSSGLVPIRDALITGLANGLSFAYSLLAYVQLQTRINTATDGFLDLIAGDFFGSSLVRTTNQTDASFRARILAAIFRERGTRNGVITVLKQLTGRTPTIFEPMRPADTGSYGGPTLAYGASGGYGSMLLPYQAFVTAFRPSGGGVAVVAPYSNLATATSAQAAVGGYGTGVIEYAALSTVQGGVSDADIYAAVESVRPVGYTLWMRISN